MRGEPNDPTEEETTLHWKMNYERQTVVRRQLTSACCVITSVCVVLLYTTFSNLEFRVQVLDSRTTSKMSNAEVLIPENRTKADLLNEDDSSSVHKDSSGAQRNVSQFLHSSTGELSVAPVPFFLGNVKNPCFALDKNSMTFENISIQNAIEQKLKIKCLPYVYQLEIYFYATMLKWLFPEQHREISVIQTITHSWTAWYYVIVYSPGVTKSGTTDLFWQFTRFHPQILYNKKEAHFWDNVSGLSPTMGNFVKQLEGPTKRIVESFTQAQTLSPGKQYIIIDGTPRTFWDGDLWIHDPLNQGLDVPKILMPQKIHRFTPQNKFIVIMRDPATRLLSDYKFFLRLAGKKSSMDFHKKVLKAIEWWKRCIELHPEKRCLYGPAPEGLPPLDIDKCILDRKAVRDLYIKKIHDKQRRKCMNYVYWANNTAGRLRVGLYEPIIREWLSVFSREQILFIQFEEYITNNVGIIQNQIYPFLGLPKLTGKYFNDLKKGSRKKHNQSRSHLTMLPETKAALKEFYAPYNKRLYKLLGDEKWLWK